MKNQEKPNKTPIHDLMEEYRQNPERMKADLKELEAEKRPRPARGLFKDQAATAAIDDEGNVVTPEVTSDTHKARGMSWPH